MRDFATDSGGATSIEYAMIASLISIVIVTAVTSIGTQVRGFFTAVSSNLK